MYPFRNTHDHNNSLVKGNLNFISSFTKYIGTPRCSKRETKKEVESRMEKGESAPTEVTTRWMCHTSLGTNPLRV